MPSLDEILAELRGSKTSLDDTNPYLKAMIYGGSGNGKTVEALHLAQQICPKGKRIFMVDSAEGWVSALNHPDWNLTKNVTRFNYGGYTMLQVLAQAMDAQIDDFDNVGVLIIDEFSTMTKLDLDVVLKARAKKDPTKDKDAPTQPDFYANTERMRKLILGEDQTPGLLQLPMHVIIVAHERVDKDEFGRETISPAFMPKFNQYIKENLHLVARVTNVLSNAGTENEEVSRVYQCFPYGKVDAKTRIGGLGNLVDTEEFNGILVQWTNHGTLSETDIVPDVTNIAPVESSDDFDDAAIQVD